MTGDELRAIGNASGTHCTVHVSLIPELASALDDRKRLEWVFNICNHPSHGVLETGKILQRVIAGGIVGDTVHEDERTAIDAKIEEEGKA